MRKSGSWGPAVTGQGAQLGRSHSEGRREQGAFCEWPVGTGWEGAGRPSPLAASVPPTLHQHPGDCRRGGWGVTTEVMDGPNWEDETEGRLWAPSPRAP